MALTRITKGVIKPNENYDTHNINSTGIVTAIGLDVNGNGDISGNLNVGGVLTYEDVTSVDSVGIITARDGIHVGAGVSAVGIITASSFRGDGSALTGISAGVTVQDEGSALSTAGTTLNFVGSGVVASGSGSTKTITIGGVSVGGASSITMNDDVNLNFGTDLDYRVNYKSSSGRLQIIPKNTSDTAQVWIESNDQMWLISNDNGMFLNSGGQNVMSLYGGFGGGIYFKNNNTQYLKLEYGKWTFENNAEILIPDKIVHAGDTNTMIRFPANDTFTVETGGNEALRVTSNNRILIGTSSSRSVAAGEPLLQIENTTTELFSILNTANDTGGPVLAVGKTRNGAIVQNNDTLGKLGFYGDDGNDVDRAAADIMVKVDGTPGTNDMPGRLILRTTAVGGSTPTERLRIDSSGRVMIGNTDAGSLYASGNNLVVGSGGASNQGITIYTGNAQQGILAFADGTSGGAQQYAGYMIYDHNTNNMLFATQATERLRITSGGAVGINQTAPEALLHVENDNAHSSTYYLNSDAAILVDNKNNSGKAVIKLEHDAALVYGSGSSSFIIADRENERLRIGSAGQIGLSGANYGTSGQVLTSQGSGSAVQWASPSTSTDPSTGVANNNVNQLVVGSITWSSGYNNTDNTLGSVSYCNQSNVYAIDVFLVMVFNNGGGTYNYNSTHNYLIGYVYQAGKNYLNDGVVTQAQHFDMYYNLFGTVYTIPWDPSGTQSLKFYCTSAYNTNTNNYFNFHVINKWIK